MKKSLFVFVCFLAFCCQADVTDNFSDEQIIALTILGEARGEGAGMSAVGQVILNRATQRNRPARSVCLRKKQFSFWNHKFSINYYKKLLKTKESKIALTLAEEILKNRVINRQIGAANHYCTIDTHPYWTKGKRPIVVIGNHKFYEL